MQRDDFQETLLGIMERKTHWAWSSFTNGLVAADRLHIHLEQEYATYVRDFPILVARAFIACPIAVVRRELIENVYEEETGRIQAGRPHPELSSNCWPANRGCGAPTRPPRCMQADAAAGARGWRGVRQRSDRGRH